jgi:hypothetical protein
MEVIRRIYVHILMLDTIQVPTYARYLKVSSTRSDQYPRRIGSCLWKDAVLLSLMVFLIMGDPSVPTISCLISTQKFDQALCDLRASMSVMPKVIYDQLNHDSLVPTSMHLQLADQSIWRLVGIVEDISVRIRNSFLPVDFVVLEMDVCR